MSTPIRDRSHLAFTSGHRRGFAAGLALALAVAPLPAVASQGSSGAAEPVAEPTEPAPDPQLEQAMKAYERGTQNYNLAQYEAALADFKEAASLYASADFQYNIGLCYEKLGKYDEAIRAYATYLKAKPDAEDRPNVENRITELRAKIEEEKQKAEEAEAERQRKEAAALEAAKNQPREGGTEDDEPVDDGRPLVLAGAALIGVGAAVALGGGIGFGAAARQRSLSVTDVIEGNPEDLSFEETQALDDEGRRFEAIQIGMAAGGAAVAVTGAVLLALGLRKRKAAASASAWLGPSMAGITFTQRF